MVQEESLEQLRNKLMKKLYYDQITGEFHWLPTYVRAGHYDPKGYVQIRFEGRLWQAHHLAFLIMTGEVPDLVDHKDRNKHNNSWANLRKATKQVNAINTGIFSNNTSSVKGVSWHKAAGKWTAQIRHNGRKIHLGTYSKLVDAVEARLRAEEELWRDIR